MTRTILHLGFMFALGCSRPVPTMATVSNTATAGWCFRVLGKSEFGVESGMVCTERLETCLRIHGGAIKYGRLAALLAVGECSKG